MWGDHDSPRKLKLALVLSISLNALQLLTPCSSSSASPPAGAASSDVLQGRLHHNTTRENRWQNRRPARARREAQREERNLALAQELPTVPFGQNASPGQMEAACPSRNYQRCFMDALMKRYPQHNLFMQKRPLASAPENARLLLPNCSRGKGGDEEAPLLRLANRGGASGASTESFVLSALSDTRVAQAAKLRERLRSGLDRKRGSLTASLRCASPADRLDRSLVALLGIPTSHNGRSRRDAARRSWLALAPRSDSTEAVVGCFVLSAHYRGGGK